jgi:hypothetical protein
VLVSGGAVALATLGIGRDASGGEAESGLPPRTAAVTRQSLKDIRSEDGVLGFGATTTVAGRLPGTFTALPAEGARIGRGRVLYEVDDKPVMLMYGSTPAYRALTVGDEGEDVRQLEANLAALGYTGFTVDKAYSDRTAKAVEEWQKDQGLPRTGEIEFGRVVFAPGAVRVNSLQAAEGDPAAPGGKVLAYTGTDKAVSMELDTADRQLAKKGTKVAVRLPDDTTVEGTVTEVHTVIQPAAGQQEAKTKVKVVVGLRGEKAQKASAAYALAAVHVDFTADTRRDVLTVPVAALLVLAEGGFGVEVVEGATSRYLPVTTGLFADGRVEISGSGVTEGTRVGMPA